MSVLTAGELAWLAVLPCSLVLIALILVLGPPLGHLLEVSTPARFWPALVAEGVIRPEDTEHARYLLALLGPLLIGGAAFALTRSQLRLQRSAAAVAGAAAKAVVAGFVVAAVLYQHRLIYDVSYSPWLAMPSRTVYFTWRTLLIALLIAGLVVVALRRRSVVTLLAPVAQERRTMRACALAMALVVVALWLLPAFNTDTTLARAHEDVWLNVYFWIDEPFAIVNGQAPLVDFHALYGQLWAYLAAGALMLFGTTFTVYALTMLAGIAVSMLAVFATFRRLTANSALALALFLPFVATSFFMEDGPLANRYAPVNLFNEFPIRYAGPYVLLWLVVRRLDRGSTRSSIPLFLFAGLVALNNLDFGGPAFCASLVALLLADPGKSWARLARLCGQAVVGLVGAIALVVGLTLAVSGSLPNFEWLQTFPRFFLSGYLLLPMPRFGLHLAIYVTFGAALVTAIARVLARDEDAMLTGALAWASVFGLGASVYFVGRSHPHVLIDMFSAWSLALSLLLIVTVRAIVRRPSRWPSVVELLVLAGFGVTVCSLAQTPTPWSQLERMRREAPPVFLGAEVLPAQLRQEVAMLVRKDEPVAVLIREGHRIASDVGIRNITPYTNIEAMVTLEQWIETVVALRRAGGTRLLVQRGSLTREQTAWLSQLGFVQQQQLSNVVAFQAPA